MSGPPKPGPPHFGNLSFEISNRFENLCIANLGRDMRPVNRPFISFHARRPGGAPCRRPTGAASWWRCSLFGTGQGTTTGAMNTATFNLAVRDSRAAVALISVVQRGCGARAPLGGALSAAEPPDAEARDQTR
jgi:hypothetical protein